MRLLERLQCQLFVVQAMQPMRTKGMLELRALSHGTKIGWSRRFAALLAGLQWCCLEVQGAVGALARSMYYGQATSFEATNQIAQESKQLAQDGTQTGSLAHPHTGK